MDRVFPLKSLVVAVLGAGSFFPQAHANNHLESSISGLDDEIRWLQEEVFVTTATKTKETLKKSGSSISVITADQLRTMGARTLYDALKRLPGLGVSQSATGLTSLEVRGVKTDFAEKVLFLINGHPVNNNLVNGGANFGYDTFITEDIESVEVVRGPGSALYGANAFVAVVNIITKTATDIRGVEVSAGTGNDETNKLNVQFGHQGQALNVAANFHLLSTDGLNEHVESDALGQSGATDYWQRRYEASGNFSYQGFYGQAKYVQRTAGSYLGVANALNDDTEQELISSYTELGYRTALSSDLDVDISAYWDHLSADNIWEIFPEGAVVPGACPNITSCLDGFMARPPMKQNTTGIEAQFDYQLMAGNKLVFGTLFEYQDQYDVEHWLNFGTGPLQDVSANLNWNGDHHRKIYAAYLQDIWDVTDDLRMIIGARYDDYSDIGHSFNPRASLTWSFLDNARLVTSYGSAFRAPTFGELYNTQNVAIVGNPNVNPEEIETFEIGLKGEIGRRTSYGLMWFRNDIKELISTVTGGNSTANVGEVQVDGVELEVMHRFSDGSDIGANYTYQHPVNQLNDQRLADVPLHRANVTFNYFVTQHINFFTGAMYKGKTARAVGDTRSEVEDYVTVDMAVVTRDLWVPNLELKLSAYNVLNKEYVDPAPNVMLSDYPKDGQNFMLEALYRFE